MCFINGCIWINIVFKKYQMKMYIYELTPILRSKVINTFQSSTDFSFNPFFWFFLKVITQFLCLFCYLKKKLNKYVCTPKHRLLLLLFEIYLNFIVVYIFFSSLIFFLTQYYVSSVLLHLLSLVDSLPWSTIFSCVTIP